MVIELRFGLCLAALLGRLLHKPVLLLLSSFRGGVARLLLRGAGVVSPLMRQGKNGVACVDKYMQPVVTGWGAEGVRLAQYGENLAQVVLAAEVDAEQASLGFVVERTEGAAVGIEGSGAARIGAGGVGPPCG